jgi:virulence factor
MRVAVIGLGDIADKAYLPVVAARADIDIAVCSRNPAKVDEVGDAYRITRRYTDVGDLLAAGLDAAFVHVATAAHVEVVTRLLDAGVATYVDKPLADNLRDCEALVGLACAKKCSLFVGFNRRYAPIYRDRRDPSSSFLFLQKNRVGLADTARRVVFDDFVHVVDTLRFLAPQAEFADAQGVGRDGKLESLVARFTGKNVMAIGSMNRNGGYAQELLETHGPRRRTVVRDMADVDEFRDGRHTVVRGGDWTPVYVRRGFAAICATFLDAVRGGHVVDAGDALRTHEVCERIVADVEASTR